MARRFRLNRFDLFAMGAVFVTSVLFIDGAIHSAELYTSVQVMSAEQKIAGCMGWLLATFGPIVTAVGLWRWFKHLRSPWLHLLMLPVAYAWVKVGSSLMLSAIGVPDFDDTIGGPVVQAMALFLLATGGYYTAALWVVFNTPSEQAHGS
jgi:hypothetical protein